MKKNPVKNINAPTYPTLEQLKVGGPKHPISKIAAVTALTAAMALAAGCGEENVKRKAGSFLGKHIDETEETYQLMGDTTTETTPWELDGETTPWELDGVAQADPTEDYVLSGGETVETTVDCLDIQGGEAVYTETIDDPSETTDWEMSGDVAVSTEEV